MWNGCVILPRMNVNHITPVLNVSDIAASFAWFEKWGWKKLWDWGTPPTAPPPGTFLGDRPTQQKPDGPLADDDRAGLRMLYPDPGDTVNVGAIGGRVLPANPFALALEPETSMGQSVTGMFGAQVVALDADTSAVVAGTLAGWTCDPLNPPTVFDGTFQIERLPVGGNYKIYAEPFVGLVQPGDMSEAVAGLCRPGVNPRALHQRSTRTSIRALGRHRNRRGARGGKERRPAGREG